MYYYLVPIYGKKSNYVTAAYVFFSCCQTITPCSLAVIALVVSLVLLVKLGVHLPTVLRGFLFYIQIAPIAMAYFPESFNLDTDVVG